MVQRNEEFGAELRRLRLAAGLSLAGLAQRVHYSKGQLSKVERGIKPPSRMLARLCDTALGADGRLCSLIYGEPVPTGIDAVADKDNEVWLMQLSENGPDRLTAMSRRQAMEIGAVSMAGIGFGRKNSADQGDRSFLLHTFHSFFEQYRKLGQSVEPGLLLPALVAQTHTLRELAGSTDTNLRQAFLRLGSRYAEYVGWLVQETGDDRGALWWTRRAVTLAAEGNDHDLAAYGLVRHALVALYRDDARQTIVLARRAQEDTASPRIRGLAAQREAQGHALAGDYDSCMRSLDRARSLLGRELPKPERNSPVIGTTNLADPAEMIKGWCLYDLGRPAAAAQVIGDQLELVPAQASRTRVRYGVRLALAQAAAGEVDDACRLVGGLLDSARQVGTATIAADLRALSRTLSRHPKNPSVRELAPELGIALQAITL